MTLTHLVDRILALPKTGRQLVAVAGAPASGKSTLAEKLTEQVIAAGRDAHLVPMDGFHLDNKVIEPLGLLPRKGAPETFDAAGFVHLMHRLKSGDDVAYPRFDRERDLSIAGAEVIPASCDIAIVEGNYLLFDEDPWRELASIWDFSVRLDVSVEELHRRLVDRWRHFGLSDQAAIARAEQNDLPNAQRVVDAALPADETIVWPFLIET